jgi:hypothetical protein
MVKHQRTDKHGGHDSSHALVQHEGHDMPKKENNIPMTNERIDTFNSQRKTAVFVIIDGDLKVPSRWRILSGTNQRRPFPSSRRWASCA